MTEPKCKMKVRSSPWQSNIVQALNFDFTCPNRSTENPGQVGEFMINIRNLYILPTSVTVSVGCTKNKADLTGSEKNLLS